MTLIVQKNPNNPERFIVMDGDTAVAQGAYGGRDDAAIISAVGSKQQNKPSWSLSPDSKSLLGQTDGNQKTLNAIKTANEIIRAQNSQQEKSPESIIEALGKQIGRMKQAGDEVPTGSGLMTIPTGAGQWIKQKVGINPALDEYQGLRGNIATQTARKLAGEKGALAEGDVKRAYGMFPDLPFESTEATQRKWKAVKELMEIVTGKKLDDMFNESSVESTPPFQQTQHTGPSSNKIDAAKKALGLE